MSQSTTYLGPAGLLEQYPGSSYRDLTYATEPGWSVLNPSIAQGPAGEYKCILRTSNYVVRTGQYIVNDPENIVRTRNYLCDLDDSLHITAMEWIDDSTVSAEPAFTLVRNMEDARLFWSDMPAGWFASGTSREHRADGIPKIALDRLDGSVVASRVIMRDDDFECEKNWMPYPTPGGSWVYSISPAKLVAFDGTVYDEPTGTGVGYPALRGSSQLIRWRGGYLGVSHEVTWEPTRYYWHRFVFFNSMGAAECVTAPFFFVAPGIEFANGIVLHGDDVVVSFGQNDERAMLATVPQSAVASALGA